MKRTILSTLTLVALVGGGLGAYFEYVEPRPAPKVSAATITTGDIFELVNATGTLTPLRTVDVGTQVSGTVMKLYVDFNSIVKKGQLLAKLDPSALEDALDSARAMADQAQGALDEEQLTLENDRRNLERASELFAGGVATRQELDDATVAVEEDDAQIVEDQASVTSAQSGVKAAEINLSYCSIYSPVDGVVLSRNVEEGQAVAARMAAPSLYIVATDLKNLQLIGDVDESGVGRLRPGQRASFTVAAYPAEIFDGTLTEVRLNSTTINNVVTYQAVITVPNADLRLLPAMTANLSIETSRAVQAVRVPNRALHFQPTAGMFMAFGESGSAGATVSAAAGVPSDASAAVTGAGAPKSAPNTAAQRAMARAAGRPGASIDQFFEPLPATARAAQVWVIDHHRLVQVPIEVGITDGTWTQVLSGNVQPGEEIVGSILVPPAARLTR